jgi:hypothetical protein
VSPPDAGASSVAASAADAGVPARPTAGGAGAFAACASDADCIAVPKGGCCNNGYKEAVNKAQASAYAASVTCEKHRMCPQYIVNDTRVARCSPSANKCVMVAPGTDPK